MRPRSTLDWSQSNDIFCSCHCIIELGDGRTNKTKPAMLHIKTVWKNNATFLQYRNGPFLAEVPRQTMPFFRMTHMPCSHPYDADATQTCFVSINWAANNCLSSGMLSNPYQATTVPFRVNISRMQTETMCMKKIPQIDAVNTVYDMAWTAYIHNTHIRTLRYLTCFYDTRTDRQTDWESF